MNKFSRKELISNLEAMQQDLLSVKKAAQNRLKEIKAFDDLDTPVELPGDEDVIELGDEFEPFEDELPFEEDDEPTVIEDASDAEKVLEEAREAIEDVIDALDNIAGEAGEEVEASRTRVLNPKYATKIESLHKKAAEAMISTARTLKHYSGLKPGKKTVKANKGNEDFSVSSEVTPESLKHAGKAVKEAISFIDGVKRALGLGGKEGTAVPPTGADFSDDKWPSDTGDPAQVELNHWEAGARKFHNDKDFENARPNPAVDKRVDTDEYSRDEKPYVNATFVLNNNDKYSSYWDIVDTRSGRRMRTMFSKAPKSLWDSRLDKEGNFKAFSSKAYGANLVDHVMKLGMPAVKADLNGEWGDFKKAIASLRAKGQEYQGDDKETVRKYYTDAYGDPEYSRKLTSSKKKEAVGDKNIRQKGKDDPEYDGYHKGKSETPSAAKDAHSQPREDETYKASSVAKLTQGFVNDGLSVEEAVNKAYATLAKQAKAKTKPKKEAENVPDTHQSETGGLRMGYDPKDEHPTDKNTDKDTGMAKDGPGKITSKDPEALRAQARRCVELATQLAARGGLKFDSKSVHAKASEFFKLNDEQFKAVEATIKNMPVVNSSLLKAAELPDAETGVVGNPLEGVSDPKAQVDTQEGDAAVESDAEITGQEVKSSQKQKKTASVVPQVAQDTSEGQDMKFVAPSIADRLKAKGIDRSSLRTAQYRNR